MNIIQLIFKQLLWIKYFILFVQNSNKLYIFVKKNNLDTILHFIHTALQEKSFAKCSKSCIISMRTVSILLIKTRKLSKLPTKKVSLKILPLKRKSHHMGKNSERNNIFSHKFLTLKSSNQTHLFFKVNILPI